MEHDDGSTKWAQKRIKIGYRIQFRFVGKKKKLRESMVAMSVGLKNKDKIKRRTAYARDLSREDDEMIKICIFIPLPCQAKRPNRKKRKKYFSPRCDNIDIEKNYSRSNCRRRDNFFNLN